MATVRPFRALRPVADKARTVASPPYDVINTREAKALAAGNPDSFLHVSRPEIDLPDGTDEHSAEVYARAPVALAELCARRVLVEDPEARLYVYAQTMHGHRQTGVVACVSVAEYLGDTIRKHEKTRADKEDDRTRHIETLGAHDEPVFLAYRADADIDAAVARAVAAPAVYDFVTDDGVGHTFWVLSAGDSADLAARFARVPTLYVADGHHRSAAAARVHALHGGTGDGAGTSGVFPAVLFPDVQLRILPYNRLVRDRRGRGPEALRDALGAVLDVTPAASPQPDGPCAFGMYLGGRWYTARVRPGTFDPGDPVASLDASLCQDQVLGPVFGIGDPRRDDHVDFVGGIRGTDELERRVAAEGWSLAIALHPTRIEQLLAVSDAGLLMPPKSTWFEPKLRSGLFVHRFG